MLRKGLVVVLVAGLAFAAGCQKLNYSETAELKMGDVWEKGFTAPAYDQSLRVTVEPESCSVSAYVVADSRIEEFRKVADSNREPPKDLYIVGQTFKRSDSKQNILLEGTVPAKTGYWVYVSGGKVTTKIKVKVVGK